MRVPTVGGARTRANTGAAVRPGATKTPAYQPKDYTGWTMQQANDWRNQAEREIQRRRAAGKDVSNWQRHFQDASAYIRSLRNPNEITTQPVPETPAVQPPAPEQPAQPAPAPEAAPAPAPAPEGAPPPANPDQPVAPGFDWNSYQSPMTKALMDALGQGMNTMRAYEPQYFEGSPMYQFQKDKGSRDLERLLAARGLTGSGAEIQANTDFITQLNATEAEKQRQYADQTAQRVQDAMRFIANYDQTERENLRNQANQNKDRELELSTFDATRNDNFRNFVIDSMLRNLGLQAGASPMSDVYNATGAQAGIFGDIANSIFNFQRTNFNPVVPATGGAPAITPPPPPAADTTALDILGANFGRQNAGGNTSVWNTVLSSLFGGR